MLGSPPKRLHYFDNARALASILGLVFHAALIFTVPWIINSDPIDVDSPLLGMTRILSTFRMPLFLFISGYFTRFGLERYQGVLFLKHRSQRILLPFVSSLLLLLPLLRLSQHVFYFGWCDPSVYFASINPVSIEFSLSHLWFLHHILIYSLLAYFLRFLFVGDWAKNRIDEFVYFFHRRRLTVLLFWIVLNVAALVVGAVLSELLPQSSWLSIGSLAINLPTFLFGYYCHKHSSLTVFMFRPSRSFAILASVAILIAVWSPAYTGWFEKQVGTIVLRWVVMIFVLQILFRFLNKSNLFLRYLSEASYPIYLFHQPMILLCGSIVLTFWPQLPTLFGYTLTLLLSTGGTYLTYELLIRRLKLGSLLFTGQ